MLLFIKSTFNRVSITASLGATSQRHRSSINRKGIATVCIRRIPLECQVTLEVHCLGGAFSESGSDLATLRRLDALFLMVSADTHGHQELV